MRRLGRRRQPGDRAADPDRRRRDGERRRSRSRWRVRCARARAARGGRDPRRRMSRPDALELARENAVGHAVADRIAFARGGPAARRTSPSRSTSCSPTCRTSGTTRWPALPRATSFEPALALDGGAGRARVIGRLLDRLPGGAGRRTGSPCSRSGRTRARRSSSSSRQRLPGWPCAVELDLAGLPRVAGSCEPGPGPASPAPSASVGHHQGRAHRSRRPSPSCPSALVALDIDGTLVGDDLIDRPAHTRGGRPRGTSTGASLVSPRHRPDGVQRDALRARARPRPPRSSATRARSSARCPRGSPRARAGCSSTRRWPRRVAREIVVWTREQGLDPHLNHLERFIVRADDPRADEYTTFMGAHAELEDDLVASIRHPVTKVMCRRRAAAPDRGRAARAGPRSPAAPRSRSAIRISSSSSRRASRRAARCAGWRVGCGVPLGAMLAIGDQWNDIEMLAEVGHGAAMPTAPAEVQAVARYIAPPLAEEGVGADDRGPRAGTPGRGAGGVATAGRRGREPAAEAAAEAVAA